MDWTQRSNNLKLATDFHFIWWLSRRINSSGKFQPKQLHNLTSIEAKKSSKFRRDQVSAAGRSFPRKKISNSQVRKFPKDSRVFSRLKRSFFVCFRIISSQKKWSWFLHGFVFVDFGVFQDCFGPWCLCSDLADQQKRSVFFCFFCPDSYYTTFIGLSL